MAKGEEEEQILLCDYIKEKYPNVIFNSDHSGIRTSIGLAKRLCKLKSENSIPDLNIDEPRGGWFGLKIELKVTGRTIFKKDGFLRKSPDLESQWRMLVRLESNNYCAGFAQGLNEAKEIVDWYMSLPITQV